ncbi:MAG: exosortase-associated EpsI family protein [Thermoguttaceae bacterium]
MIRNFEPRCVSRAGATSVWVMASILIVLTVAVTGICGVYTGRWQSEKPMVLAAERLKTLPTTIGEWEMYEETTLKPNEVAMLEVEGRYLTRRYRHRQTQEDVGLMILIGPSGKMIVHTPEVCLGGVDYVCDAGRLRVAIASHSEKTTLSNEDSFWKVSFQRQSSRGDRVLFYYALSSGGDWVASDNPRMEFRGCQFLYKIQLDTKVPPGESPTLTSTDAAARFLDDALPTIDAIIKGSAK